MFRRPSRDALYERVIAEKNTHLRILVAEVDWLRAQLGRPSLPATITAAQIANGTAAKLDDGEWMSEADEAQKIVEDLGLSAVHLPEILDGLGLSNSDFAS